jgi:hypothetical protein
MSRGRKLSYKMIMQFREKPIVGRSAFSPDFNRILIPYRLKTGTESVMLKQIGGRYILMGINQLAVLLDCMLWSRE